MKKSVSFVVALLLAGSASLAIAQFRPEAEQLNRHPQLELCDARATGD